MRKLAIACASGAIAVCLSFYCFPQRLLLPLAALCLFLAIGTGLFLLRGRDSDLVTEEQKLRQRRRDMLHRVFLCALGAAIGFGVYAIHWNSTLRYAALWDGTEQTMTVRLVEYPLEADYGTRLHVKRTEPPKLDFLLYDYADQTPEALRPGDVLEVSAGLRRADLRYGEQNNNYISKDIYMTGTLRGIGPTEQHRPTLRTFAAVCSRLVSDYAGRLFTEKTAVFMRALMLGDRTDFYQDTALYARMRGAGLLHVAAVSGVKHLRRIGMQSAKKPLNWGVFAI